MKNAFPNAIYCSSIPEAKPISPSRQIKSVQLSPSSTITNKLSPIKVISPLLSPSRFVRNSGATVFTNLPQILSLLRNCIENTAILRWLYTYHFCKIKEVCPTPRIRHYCPTGINKPTMTS